MQKPLWNKGCIIINTCENRYNIVVGNESDAPSSNPGCGCLHFILN